MVELLLPSCPVISIVGPSLTHRAVGTRRGVGIGLVLNLSVQLCTQNYNEPGKVEPEQKYNNCRNAAIGLIIFAEVIHVEGEQ